MRYTIPLLLLIGLISFLTIGGENTRKAAIPKGTAWLKAKPVPQWIWHKSVDGNSHILLRKTFQLSGKVKAARLYTTCDNKLKLRINGKLVGESPDWMFPLETDVVKHLKPGKNVIAADCRNAGGPAGFVLKLAVITDKGETVTVISDKSWKLSTKEVEGWFSADFDDSSWKSTDLKQLAKLGSAPWGIPNYTKKAKNAGGNRLDPENITTRPGFVVDHIYTVPKSTQGSWVSLTTGPKGEFYACDQGGKGLFRITVTADGKPDVEKVPVNVSGAQGLLWAFDSLWFHRNGGNLYRITDSDGDGKLDKTETMPSRTGGGEHGNHAVILTEDGKGLYLAGGNHAPLAELKAKRVQNWAEDFLMPRMWDARGHARGVMAPGGWVTRFDPKTQTQELICSGFRNEYDIALNRHGDLFTYDSDMEWDLGLPWYRPTRICQVVSGGDYGWRSGTGKWPPYFEDSLPPVVDIGPGSPTGVVSGIGAKFPAKYQDAIFALDWTFGTIYAIHLTPKGAGYTGKSEPFVYGAPLPVTDAIIGKDGAMYFLIGGRGSQSAMFRVRYTGKESTEPGPGNDNPEATKARKLRKQLETFHGRQDKNGVEQAWPHLSSPDRFLRNAARVAIESQPVAEWAERVYQEKEPQARITSAVALARCGDKTHRKKLVASLLDLDPSKLKESQFLGLLRAYSLTFIRLGAPLEQERLNIIDELDPFLPAKSSNLNTELIRLLVYLRSPTVVAKGIHLIDNRSEPEIPEWTELASRNPGYGGTVQRMIDNHPPSVEIGYAYQLRNVRYGWTLPQRRSYFKFLNEAAKGSGGASFPGYLTRIREEALANCTNEERKALEDITGENFNPEPNFEIVKPKGPGRKWTTQDVMSALRGKANFERGRSLFFSASCAKCHRIGDLGGNVGPDLTSLPKRFDQRYVVEAIIDPSKDISDQFGSHVVELKSGKFLTGLVVQHGEELELFPADVNAKSVKFSRKDVAEISPSSISQMPNDLLNSLNAEEVRDLIAFLMASGNPKDRRFRK